MSNHSSHQGKGINSSFMVLTSKGKTWGLFVAKIPNNNSL